jgi:glycosyltransferase involved in cell wall biosynthesis
MIEEISQYVDKHIIITKEKFQSEYKNTTVVSPDGNKNGVRYWLWAANTAKKEINSKPVRGGWIVHEHVVGYIPTMVKAFTSLYNYNIATVASLYAADLTCLVERRWRMDPNDVKISIEQEYKYQKLFLKKCIKTVPSWIAVDIVTGNSREVETNVKKVMPKKKVKVVPTSIHKKSFIGGKREMEVGWDDGRLKLLYVGRITPYKGIATMLSALKQCQNIYEKNMQLLMLGSTKKFDKTWFQRLVNSYDLNIGKEIVGVQRVKKKELGKYYKKSDIFLFPSFHEGSPRVVKEALCMGTPVVASRIPGTQMLDPNENVIRFFEPGNSNDMQNQIASTVESEGKLKRISYKSKKLASEFTPNKIAKKFAKVYGKIQL